MSKQVKRHNKKQPSNSLPFTLNLWVYIENCGDGSAVARFYNTEEEANSAADEDDERFCDDVYETSITIDPTTGKLVV